MIKKIVVCSVLLISILALSACSNSSDESSTTTRGSTTTRPEHSSSNELQGSWTANASDLLQSNTSGAGSLGSLDCTGDVTITFEEDTASGSGDIQCKDPRTGIEATGNVAWTASYSIHGNTLTITDSQNTGTITVAGTQVPAPATFEDGQATFEINGDTLTTTVVQEPLGEVSQTYTRVR